MPSYLVEGLPDGQWRWTIFSENRKTVKTGSAKGEDDAKLAALNAIDELKLKNQKSGASF